MRFFIATAIVLFLAHTFASAESNDKRLPDVVSSVDTSRYMGKWYEIARFPNRFQKKCAGNVTATYELQSDGRIKVINECRDQKGETDRAEGTARRQSKQGPNSKLEVRFAPSWLSWLPAVWGDYWILELADDYSYSLVGSPDRKYLWILSRAPQMDEATYQKLVEAAKAKGYEVGRLARTSQQW
jgi:apolipoprotein D and lipocalin family protein